MAARRCCHIRRRASRLGGVKLCSRRRHERPRGASACSPPFPLARGQGHERTGRVRLPFLKDIGNHGLVTLRHELCDLATQDGAGDPGVITRPDRHAGREPLFGNLLTTDEKQQTRSAVSDDAATPREMAQQLGASGRPFNNENNATIKHQNSQDRGHPGVREPSLWRPGCW